MPFDVAQDDGSDDANVEAPWHGWRLIMPDVCCSAAQGAEGEMVIGEEYAVSRLASSQWQCRSLGSIMLVRSRSSAKSSEASSVYSDAKTRRASTTNGSGLT